MKCTFCEKKLYSNNRNVFCTECWHKDINGVKTSGMKKYWRTKKAKLSHFKRRGVNIEDPNIARHWDAICCDLCGDKFSETNVSNLDHCHSTGNYRGSLCRQCNTALGKLGDDLEMVIKRLENYNNQLG